MLCSRREPCAHSCESVGSGVARYHCAKNEQMIWSEPAFHHGVDRLEDRFRDVSVDSHRSGLCAHPGVRAQAPWCRRVMSGTVKSVIRRGI